MNTEEVQAISEDMARMVTRLDNVEGYFDNFNTTLTNHMNEYQVTQTNIREKVTAVEGRLSWGFWVIFGLLTTVIAGFIGISIILMQEYLRRL